MQNYLEFRAVGNSVLGVLGGGETATICTCASVPDWIAEEVAQEIARALNAPCIKGIAFSLPYSDVSKHIK